MARKRASDLRAAKERKQKKIAAVLGVCFLIVLVVQIPRVMGMMNANEAVTPPPVPVETASVPEDDAPLAPPTLDEENPTELPASARPVETSSQLVSFSRFESKDPFAQQMGETDPATDSTPEAPAGEGAEEPEGMFEVGEGGQTPATGPGPAAITVNGVLESVTAGQAFPQANPMFVLLSLAKKAVVIGVAEGGSFSSGGEKLTLELGKPVTLVNTADGTRFVIELKSVA